MIEIFALIILILVLLLADKYFELKNILNPYIFFLLFHIVFFYIAIFYANRYESVNIYISEDVKYLIIYSLFFSFIGAFFAYMVFSAAGTTYKKVIDLTIIDNSAKNSIFYYTTLFIFIIGISLAFYYTYKIGGFIWLQGNFEDLRISSRKGSGFITIISIVFTTYSATLLILMRRTHVLFKILIFLVASIALISFGNRGPLLKFVLLVLILLLIIKKPTFKLSTLVFYGLLVLSLMILLGALRKGPDELLDIFINRIPWRPFVNLYTFQIILDNFPSHIPFLHGEGYLIDLETILPGYQPNLGTWVKDKLGMTFEGGSVTFSYLGDGYINFDLIGIFIYPILFGFMLNSIYLLMAKNRYISLQKLIFLSLLSVGFAGSVNVGFMGPFIYNIIPIIIVFYFHTFLNTIFQLKGVKL